MLVDRRFYIRQGRFPKVVLTAPQIFKAQGTLDGSQLIEPTTKQRRESL
jgi:hypothetical protein